MRLPKWRALQTACLVAIAAVALTTATPLPAHAAIHAVMVDGMEFRGNPMDPGTGALLERCTSSVADDLEIPSRVTISGVTMDVVAIRWGACNDGRVGRSLTSITIPDTVTDIGDSAFKDVNATSLRLGARVTRIGTAAFEGNALTTLVVPEGVETIENWAFYSNQLTSVTLPDSLTRLGSGALGKNHLTHFEIPPLLTILNDRVLDHNQLTSLTSRATSGVTIDLGALSGNAFTTLVIPDGITEIREVSFAVNPVESVHIPSSVTKIETFAFLLAPITTVSFAGNAPTLESDWANVNGATVYYYKGATGFAPGDWPSSTLVELVTVAFDTGGDGTTPAPVDVPTGSAVTPPTLMDRPGFDFVGWFDAPTGGNPVDFTAISDHLTAYAQWLNIPETLTAPTGAVQGEAITLSGDGYQPHEPLEIWLLSTPVQLTTLTADATGAFTTTVTIPANVTPGAHTLEIRGAQSPTFAQSFTVFAALPATGPDPSAGPIGVAALLLTGAGVGLMLINRRRR